MQHRLKLDAPRACACKEQIRLLCTSYIQIHLTPMGCSCSMAFAGFDRGPCTAQQLFSCCHPLLLLQVTQRTRARVRLPVSVPRFTYAALGLGSHAGNTTRACARKRGPASVPCFMCDALGSGSHAGYKTHACARESRGRLAYHVSCVMH